MPKNTRTKGKGKGKAPTRKTATAPVRKTATAPVLPKLGAPHPALEGKDWSKMKWVDILDLTNPGWDKPTTPPKRKTPPKAKTPSPKTPEGHTLNAEGKNKTMVMFTFMSADGKLYAMRKTKANKNRVARFTGTNDDKQLWTFFTTKAFLRKERADDEGEYDRDVINQLLDGKLKGLGYKSRITTTKKDARGKKIKDSTFECNDESEANHGAYKKFDLVEGIGEDRRKCTCYVLPIDRCRRWTNVVTGLKLADHDGWFSADDNGKINGLLGRNWKRTTFNVDESYLPASQALSKDAYRFVEELSKSRAKTTKTASSARGSNTHGWRK